MKQVDLAHTPSLLQGGGSKYLYQDESEITKWVRSHSAGIITSAPSNILKICCNFGTEATMNNKSNERFRNESAQSGLLESLVLCWQVPVDLPQILPPPFL